MTRTSSAQDVPREDDLKYVDGAVWRCYGTGHAYSFILFGCLASQIKRKPRILGERSFLYGLEGQGLDNDRTNIGREQKSFSHSLRDGG